MKPPSNWIEVKDGKRYDVSKAILLAGDDYWDGHNFERHGRPDCFSPALAVGLFLWANYRLARVIYAPAIRKNAPGPS